VNKVNSDVSFMEEVIGHYVSTFFPHFSLPVKMQPEIPPASIPLPVKNDEFLAEFRKTGISCSDDCQDRLFRAHGKGQGH